MNKNNQFQQVFRGGLEARQSYMQYCHLRPKRNKMNACNCVADNGSVCVSSEIYKLIHRLVFSDIVSPDIYENDNSADIHGIPVSISV